MATPSFRILAAFGAAALGLTIGVGAALASGAHGGPAFGASTAGTGTASVSTTTSGGAATAGGYGASGGYGAGGGPGWAGAGTGTYAQTREQALATALAQPAGSLTPDQSAALASMAEEEKLALDLYTAFSQEYATPVWRNIAASEATHLATVRSLLDRYGLSDPTAGLAVGDFASLEAKSAYRALFAQGQGSESAAWAAGATVERDDIASLDAAAAGVTAPDVAAVYASLRAASTQHEASFARLAAD